MDLELSDEQVWLSESVDTLLTRTPAERVWDELVSFGALDVGGEDGLGAVELALVARALGRHLATVPFIDSAAVRFALGPDAAALGSATVAVALRERGSGWATDALETTIGERLEGEKLDVEHADGVERIAVVGSRDGAPALAVVPRDASGVSTREQPGIDTDLAVHAVAFDGVELAAGPRLDAGAVERLTAIGALLAAAEAVGAASRLLDDACAYAAERRQFGHPIGSFQALRHLLADMYVRQASSWSTVLYGAATLDLAGDDAQQTASIAKAYVDHATREVAHGAMQVFGGIAFTAEHHAHRFLRRIVMRNQQFGGAAHHEQALGRRLAARFAVAAA
jgi:alkylation response protein AidB-like acyl-CoA dehydrogenase